ncbi:squalene-associated FAD-dependent desaturase [Kribbella pratensis]|uniref:Squalene-associated FAD-dependent desaturase n=1 Tax=Kribbella pratensis TaxID=2512112 RepID=A0ABY2FJ89_9ACTN|nr:hydroxysqualene dehydroxylase HpnE [Kribbella pratensis]TDW92849.1 squalene-associated FAD-dependent desaturase [Kribbella pratensis]
MKRVAVIGGGLAGITAALELADAGCAVALFEARPKLGGLTHSFERHGRWIDNGQHVFLRCCTSYLRLLDRLGVRDQVQLQRRLDVPVRSGLHSGVGRIRRNGMPAPLHLGPALASYRWLSVAERVAAMRAALAIARVDRTTAEADAQSFGEWLAAHGQSPRAVEALWELIGIATLNARADDASLAVAATVFQLGLLERSDAADIGWSLVPLQQLHGDAAARVLMAAGVAVRLRARIRALEEGDGAWAIEGEEYDDVVLAVPPAEAAGLLPDGAVELPAGWAEALGSSPIVNAHVIFDRAVLHEPFVAGVDSPLQWVFDRTVQSCGGVHGDRDEQYLAVSLSAADELIDAPVADLREVLVPALRQLLPAAADARVKEFFVTRERHATFRAAPGSGRLRPGATTARAGLHLAGAWTATGWPATMEGAVRSGEAAAASVLQTSALPVAS